MSKRILVIDDATAIRQVVQHVLNTEGYEIVEATDGVDAIAKLDGQHFDLFICDVNMPHMNGIEFLEKIKTDDAHSSYKFTPIIMLTTEAGESMKNKGKELGARAWMVKPFRPEELLSSVKKLLA